MRDREQRGEAAPRQGLTVVIPTLNRPHELANVVSDMLRQSRRPDQIVIVDQSATADSKRAVQGIFAAAPPVGQPALHYLHDPSILGTTQARNAGIAAAEFDITAFVDDDMGMEPNFLEELERPLRADPTLAGVGGVITSYRPNPVRRAIWAIFRRGMFRDRRQMVYWNVDSLPQDVLIPSDRLAGGCVAYRTTLVREHRFDEQYRGYSLGEDAEFSLRLSRAGLRLVISPGARISHPKSPIGRDKWERRMEAEVCANYYLLRRHLGRAPGDWLSFAWLLIGLACEGAGHAIKDRSSAPLVGLLRGLLIASRGLRGCRFIRLEEAWGQR